MSKDKLKENEILIADTTYSVLPIKIKHLKNGFYANYMTVKKYGLVKLLNFVDGEQILVDLLEAVLDSKEIATKVLENLDAQVLGQLLDITKKINEIEDEEENQNPNV